MILSKHSRAGKMPGVVCFPPGIRPQEKGKHTTVQATLFVHWNATKCKSIGPKINKGTPAEILPKPGMVVESVILFSIQLRFRDNILGRRKFINNPSHYTTPCHFLPLRSPGSHVCAFVSTTHAPEYCRYTTLSPHHPPTHSTPNISHGARLS